MPVFSIATYECSIDCCKIYGDFLNA